VKRKTKADLEQEVRSLTIRLQLLQEAYDKLKARIPRFEVDNGLPN